MFLKILKNIKMTNVAKFNFYFEELLELYENVLLEYKKSERKSKDNLKKVKRLGIYLKTFKQFHFNEKKNTSHYMKQIEKYFVENKEHIFKDFDKVLSSETLNIYFNKNTKKACLSVTAICQILKNKSPGNYSLFKYYFLKLISLVVDEDYKDKVYYAISEEIESLETDEIEYKDYLKSGPKLGGDTNFVNVLNDVKDQILGNSQVSEKLGNVFGQVLSSNSFPEGFTALQQAIQDNPELFEQTQTALQTMMPNIMDEGFNPNEFMKNMSNMTNNKNSDTSNVDFTTRTITD